MWLAALANTRFDRGEVTEVQKENALNWLARLLAGWFFRKTSK